MNRAYHNTTAHFNGYFNANEKVKEGVAALVIQHKDDYDNILPIFIYGDEAAAKSIYPEMNIAIEKCSRVIERHSMKIKGKERCKWIDDNYFVIGKANFYKQSYLDAERVFGYAAREYKDGDRAQESILWLARTYIELERYSKSRNMLDILKEDEDLPKKFPKGEMAAVEAHLNLKQGRVDHAIERLEEAVFLTKKNKNKYRYAFILAQLYEHKGQNDRAVKQFEKVVKMNPPYEMAFYAKINQALAFDASTDSKGIRQLLNKMLKDEKNIEYYDQIWYALADLDLKEGFKIEAIDGFKTSALVSTSNTKQKGKSFLRLADIYFEDRMYRDAQMYYDSTSSFLPADHPQFEAVLNKAETLTELVEHVETVIVEDSLQALASLDEKELQKKINKIINERETAEEEQQRSELEAREAQLSASTPKKSGGGSSGGKGEWYFYNPTTVGKGFSEFSRKWGNRPLEDNWRRKDKNQTLSFEDSGGNEEPVAPPDGGLSEDADWKHADFYTKEIPDTPEKLAASDARIAEALYKSGLIYKERLDDNDNAIESFENLNYRYDSCRYSLESYYQLYRMYLYKEENENYFSENMKSSSGWYKDILLYDYPNSEYALLIKDPNRKAKEDLEYQAQEEVYREVFRGFKNRQYISTISTCNDVINSGEPNAFLKKYAFLKALCYGGLKDREGYKTQLRSIISTFSGTPESDEAQRRLDGLAVLENNVGDKSNGPDTTPKVESPYTFDPDSEHYFALIFPNKDGSVNNVKTKISNFNKQYFKGVSLTITNSFIDQNNQVILLRAFSNKLKAMDYFSTFKLNQDQLKELNEKNYPIFAISPLNYATLFSSKDISAYQSFFETNYLD